ncbi:hypothetical protein LARI1_G001967 [Lachnellula arida]|uniref:Protein kinase domain-containing protein n=1 Tax=Lachnellula arida TaxID=1316785 RepID=A0A8T9BM79_9HELO|nr:hypothetical protein LARI1_G001967 [Lachnellula arida]
MSSSVEAGSSYDDDHEAKISTKLAEYRPRRIQRYSAVNVLLLSWKDSDLDCADEVNALGRMFEEHFNYSVWPYLLPSEDSQSKLALLVAQFLSRFGGPDKLILVYYGGHGGPPVSTKSPCTWAALVTGGPTVDWSIIQPLFFGAECDVVIFLDCCYAGQAVRARATHSIEFLAATDKDQSTPIGLKRWPSFTRVLMDEMIRSLKDGGVLTIPGIHSRLVESRAGLQKQPFYVALSGENLAGTIQLCRWEDVQKPSIGKAQAASKRSLEETAAVYLRLSTFHPIDDKGRDVLVTWMTRDSPSSIEDIELVDKTFAEARKLNDFGLGLNKQENALGNLFSFLSDQGRQEASKLFRDLQDTLSVSQPEAWQLTNNEAMAIINNVKQRSRALTTLIEDSLTSLSPGLLKDCESKDLFGLGDLSSRIAMRLTLVQDETTLLQRRVDFVDKGQAEQRLRKGKQGSVHVLVEYCALHAEPKSTGFRTLPGVGYLHETLHGRRFGFIYRLPEDRIGQRAYLLSSLITQVKFVPLEIRNQIASVLCEALLHLHSVGWLHKGVKSDNVLIFSRGEDEDSSSLYTNYDFENPYFVGFDCSRPDDTETWSAVDFITKNNIYRHPQRWGTPKRFEKYHDIYALGILLLEIGCWRLLPSLDPKRANFESIKDPKVFRDFLRNATGDRLRHAAGTKYADATRFCFEDLRSSDYEEWQFQRLVREKIWGPLRD